ncbi:MAG: efflux RND transporter periplasmic adaptor subunit [Opitutae bacterium]|nr:efflux RND transporter periplasmic adaptor subunit [Opitutae bacterium]
MKPFPFTLPLALAAACALLASCARHTESAGDSHAGHNHAGHNHAAGEHASEPATGAKMCKEHNVPLAECGICKPELIAQLKPGDSLKVRLAATDSAKLSGVETAALSAGAIADSVECFAELSFDQRRLAQIVAPVSGILHSVDAGLGTKVEEQQPVARLWSAAIADTVAKAMLTHQTLDRERKLRADRVTAEKDLQEAEAAHRAACQQLRTFGFTEAQIDAYIAAPQDRIVIDVRAPFAGEIVACDAVRGALIEAGKPLFTLADRSTMWAMLNLPEATLAQVRVGQMVELRVDALPDRVFTGELTWIGAEVDERNRLARARAEFANPDGALRAHMFAQARILTRRNASALLLPSSAVQRIDGRPLVFVKLEDDLFDARAVRLGAEVAGQHEVLAGLRALEPVVVRRSFSLKSQLLISRLGAGCADD